jgi:dTDP-glucose 4,6-dehydratase
MVVDRIRANRKRCIAYALARLTKTPSSALIILGIQTASHAVQSFFCIVFFKKKPAVTITGNNRIGKSDMQNILITGGAGFIGSHLIRYLQNRIPDALLINLDILTYAGSMENLRDLPDPSRHIFIHGDICNSRLVEELLKTHKVDTIIHCAAETHVDRSILGPAKFIQTNIVGTHMLLEAARRVWLEEQRADSRTRRFHHISTDEVFGSLLPGDPAFSETSPYSPNSPYAASKAASDHLVRAYARTYGLPVTITNCSNNYGPRQFPEKIIPLTILLALEGSPLPVYGDGQHIRDWLFVEDHCHSIWLVLQHAAVGETFNVGGENQCTNVDLVRKICALLDEFRPDSPHRPHESLISFVPDRRGHDRRYALNIGKIKRELGWEPHEGLETGLEKTVRWYLEHMEWLLSIRSEERYQKWLCSNYSGERGKT